MPPLNTFSVENPQRITYTGKTSANPSVLEVDFDRNVTDLYDSISQSNWDAALASVRKSPMEARTWVVRYTPEGEVMWRFLPLHSACARQPPISIIRALLEAYPQGSKSTDDQGMHALHYACGNQASADVIRALLLSNKEASMSPCEPNGMLPLHYACQWGPSSIRVFDILLFSNPKMAQYRDADGNTAMDLVNDATYPDTEDVKNALSQFYEENEETENHEPASHLRDSLEALKKLHVKDNETDREPKRCQHESANKSHEAATQPELEKETNQDEEIVSKATYKTLAKLKAEVNKLRAEADFAEAEMEERIGEEREKQSKIEEDLRHLLQQTQQETRDIRTEMLAKEEFASYVESRLLEKNIEAENLQTEIVGLESELQTVNDVVDEYKTKTETLERRMEELSSTVFKLIHEQDSLVNTFKSQEEYITKAQELRVQKLKELMTSEEMMISDHEDLGTMLMSNSKTSTSMSEALEKQRELMKAVSGVVCDASPSIGAPDMD
jgi:hypothetical protein